jgi:hypothetical protein
VASYDRPWDIGLFIYPGARPTDNFTEWGAQVDVSEYVRRPGQDGGAPISYSGGRRGESAQSYGAVDYGEFSCTVDNRDGRFSTDNAMGEYWPDLDLATPLMLTVRTGYDTFTRTVSPGFGTSDSGSTWSGSASAAAVDGDNATITMATAGTAARMTMDSAGASDFDVTFTCWRGVVSTGAPLFFGAVQYQDADNYLLVGVDFGLLGAMGAKIHRVADGVFTNLASEDPIPSFTYTTNEKINIRARRLGAVVGVKIWKTVASEPDTWTTWTEDNRILAGDLGLYAWRTSGNTNANALFNFDDITLTSVEFAGLLTELPVEWDMSSNNSWAPIKATGVLRRLRQRGATSLVTPLRHQLPFYSPTDYWPLEDGEDATVFSNVVNPAYPARPSNMSPGQSTTLAGALANPVAGTGGGSIIAYTNGRGQGGTGFAVMFAAKPQTNPGSSTILARVQCSRGPVSKLEIFISGSGAGSITVNGLRADGTTVFTDTTTPGDIGSDWSVPWVAFCIKLEQSGANVNWTMLWVKQGSGTAWFMSGSYASTIIPKADLFAIGGSAWEGLAVSHIWVGPNTLPFVSSSFFGSLAGFNGESASDRIARIAEQAGIPVVVEEGDSELLGPQPQGRPVDVMQASADADFGLLYESGNGLGFRPRSARRNQEPLTTLSMAAGHIAAPPRPVRDDQRIRNKVTVTRTGGSSVTYEDTANIERHGEYEDPVTLNLKNDLPLLTQAQWRTAVGVRRGMRWSSLALDFTRNPSLLPLWRIRGFAPRLLVDLDLDQMVGANPDVIVEGWSATLSPESWTAELNCSDAKIFDTGIWDDATAGRSLWGPTGATLDISINSSTLSIPINPGTETWRTGAVTATLEINGEHIPITNVSGPSSGVYTATASSRSANGVVKSHFAGDPITLANPSRWGF